MRLRKLKINKNKNNIANRKRTRKERNEFYYYFVCSKKEPLRNVNSDNGYSVYCFLNKILSNDWVNEGNGLIVILEITILPQFNFHFVLFF